MHGFDSLIGMEWHGMVRVVPRVMVVAGQRCQSGRCGIDSSEPYLRAFSTTRRKFVTNYHTCTQAVSHPTNAGACFESSRIDGSYQQNHQEIDQTSIRVR